MVIITDGEDKINATLKPPCKLISIFIKGRNRDLEAISDVFFEINEDINKILEVNFKMKIES